MQWQVYIHTHTSIGYICIRTRTRTTHLSTRLAHETTSLPQGDLLKTRLCQSRSFFLFLPPQATSTYSTRPGLASVFRDTLRSDQPRLGERTNEEAPSSQGDPADKAHGVRDEELKKRKSSLSCLVSFFLFSIRECLMPSCLSSSHV